MEALYIYNLILIFFIYSVAGWMMEVILKYIQYHRFINRGFLIGPYLPIYGSGAVAVTVALDLLSPYEFSLGTTFVVSFFLCGFLEYMTSFVMEKRFHARWWDYTGKPMNLYGRVWIGNLILFGFGGVFIYHIYNPIIFRMFANLNLSQIKWLSIFVLVIMLSDSIVSHFIIKLLKEGVENSEADSSEAIAKEVRYLLENKSVLHKRIIDAYPEITFRTERVKQRLERVRKDTERLKALANDRLIEISDLLDEHEENLAKNFITTRNLQKSIIEIQDQIIAQLLNNRENQEEMLRLFNELEGKKKILQEREQRLKFRLNERF